LLILDEPTNGLDPNGMIEVRELLKKLNQEDGITILISSHLLAEIEKLVTHVGIINQGRLLFQGTLDDLKNRQQLSLSTIFETSDQEKVLRLMSDHNLSPRIENGKIILPSLAKETIATLNQQLVANDVLVYEISIVKNDLESIFIDMINH
jgi:lantibiotic transport system ATP-binding protein